eukprot:g2084.t1
MDTFWDNIRRTLSVARKKEREREERGDSCTKQSDDEDKEKKDSTAEGYDRKLFPYARLTPDGKGTVLLNRHQPISGKKKRELKVIVEDLYNDGLLSANQFATLSLRTSLFDSGKEIDFFDTLVNVAKIADSSNEEERRTCIDNLKCSLNESPSISTPSYRCAKETKYLDIPPTRVVWLEKTPSSESAAEKAWREIWCERASCTFAGGWRPLGHVDSRCLELAFRQNKQGAIFIGGGHFTVDLRRRIMTPTFWSGSTRRVMRATWFFSTSSLPTLKFSALASSTSNETSEATRRPGFGDALSSALKYATLCPYDEAEARAIEQAYVRRVDSYRDMLPFELPAPLFDSARSVFVDISDNSSSSSDISDEEEDRGGCDADVAAGRKKELSEIMSSIQRSATRSTRASAALSTGNLSGPLHEALLKRFADDGSFLARWSPMRHPPRMFFRALRLRPESFSSTVAAPPAADHRPRPIHVCFVVHGIGEEFCKQTSMGDIVDSAHVLRRGFADSLKRIRPDLYEKGDYIEVLPINWSSSLHSLPRFREIMDQVSLKRQGIPKFRDAGRFLFSDALIYENPEIKRIIFKSVVRRMNRAYALVREIHNCSHLPVSIVGHSLGSIISFDVLTQQLPRCSLATEKSSKTKGDDQGTNGPVSCPQLDFEPDNFFAFGSPIGFYLTVRGHAIGREWRLPTCPHMMNLFHAKDPFAHRVEPLVDLSLGETEPARVPTSDGFMPIHYRAREVYEQFLSTYSAIYRAARRSNKPTVQSTTELSAPKRRRTLYGNLNGGRRVDYVVVESAAQAAVGYLAALTSHGSYWANRDTAMFLTKRVLLSPWPSPPQEEGAMAGGS